MRYLVDFERQIIITPNLNEVDEKYKASLVAAIKYFETKGFNYHTEEDYTDKLLEDMSINFSTNPTKSIKNPAISKSALAQLDLADAEFEYNRIADEIRSRSREKNPKNHRFGR